MATVLVGLVVIMLVGAGASLMSVRARRYRPLQPGVHALRDDYAINPIVGPLRSGCGSLEIAVRLDSAGRLQLGTGQRADSSGNAIGPMVLRELALRAEAYGGSVRPGQTESITLMIDIVETEPARQVHAYDVLDAELRRYPHVFTRLTDGAVTMGPVTVMLTGSGVPRHAVAAASDRFMFCDGSFGDVGAWGAPVELVPMVSEHWAWRFGWDGTDAISTEERLMLHHLVRAAHDDGREVRMFGIPESDARVREAFWRVLLDAGVDVISTPRPRRLAAFLVASTRRPDRIRVDGPIDGVVAQEGTFQVASAR